MTEEIKLSKFDNEPWGFRLTGGKDFGTVLTVIKITKESLAERAGMRVGDLLLAINDQPLTNLTHSEAHDVIIHAGNNFVFTIVRGSLVLPPPFLKNEIPAQETKNENDDICNAEEVSNNLSEATEISMEEELIKISDTFPEEIKKLSAPQSPVPVIQVTPPSFTAVQEPLLSDIEKKNDNESQPMNEEELQDLMLGHAEVIAGGAIGVDFNKMGPKCEVIEKSEVLQAIKDEKVNEAKKTISKFLQQPNRPKIKPKQNNPPAATPYKPLIVLPKKGHEEPEIENKLNQQSSEQPSEKEKQEEQTIQEEKQGKETIQEEQKEQEDQGEQTRPPEQKVQEKQHEQIDEQTQEQTQEQANWDSDLTQEEQDILQEMAAINACISDVNDQQETECPNRSPEFEKQLKKINEQLVNLLCMPLDMQRYLIHVKKQIEELRRLKNPPPPEPEPEPEPVTQQSEQEGSVAGKSPTPTPGSEGASGKTSPQDETEGQQEQLNADSEDGNTKTTEPEPEPIEIGPPKHPRRDIQWQKDPLPKNRPFFPLTPKPRPVTLPEDAPIFHDNELFSEDFIAETLSGNAEVIQGTAIGVNFMKFKKNYDHLQSSDVYKMIHDEESNKTNFPTRSGKIPSKEDCVVSVANNTE